MLTFGVEGKSEGDEGCDDENNEGDVLHRLPDKCAKPLCRFGGNHIGAEALPSSFEIRSGKTCQIE